MLQKYTQAEDLLTDESFLAWQLKASSDEKLQWEKWMHENPDKVALVHEAQSLLGSLILKESSIPEVQIQKAEENLIQAIENPYSIDATPVVSIRRKRWWMVAASVIVLIGAALIARQFIQSEAKLKTTFGEIKEQKLPDGTEIVLNANSQVTYGDTWKEGGDREVWVDGEAFFKVQKTAQKSRFIVHTKRFDIIVTGTQFNVINRADVTNVMLKEGSIIVRTEKGTELKLLPGDFLEFTGSKPLKKVVKTENVLAWKEKKIVFENTPLTEVLQRIKSHYGVDIKLADESLGDKTITGIIANDNLDVLLQALEATMDFKVIHNNNEIIISAP